MHFLPLLLKRRGVCALVLGLAMGAALAMPPDRVYAKVAPSVWRVVAFDAHGKPFKMGSAVVVGKDTILTNCHVVADAARFTVSQGKSSITARLQYADAAHDMCQLTAPSLSAPALELGDSDALSVGQRVYALGNPNGLDVTLSDGLVSALRKDRSGKLFLIQTSAPISHGSSGGGLFDEEGRLIGLTSAGIENAQNLNFAVPIALLRDLPARGATVLHATQPPPAYADINDANKLPNTRPEVRASYEKFLARPLPRAFAVADNGGVYQAWSRIPKDPNDSPDPAVRAVSECEKVHHSHCRLYAVDRQVVYRP